MVERSEEVGDGGVKMEEGKGEIGRMEEVEGKRGEEGRERKGEGR